MAETTYTNKKLADVYFEVASQYSGNPTTYASQRKKISDATVDLSAFYQEHGDFSELHISGLGPKTRGLLELILDKGPEEAKNTVLNERIEDIRNWQSAGISRRAPRRGEDSTPSWERAVRIREDN